MRPIPRLSKSRFVSGLQCPKMLWWKVHEPDAPELAAGDELQAIFERGQRVGELARTYVRGGVLIDVPYHEVERRVAATAQALADGASVLYEASFLADGIFVAIDILERRREGFTVVEVKSTLDVKDQHIADVAVQTHVVRRAGLPVQRAEVMHLNRDCRHPDLSDLFVRENVTPLIQAALRAVPKQAGALLSTLAGPLPEVAPGAHCTAPYDCPFLERCWPPLPEHPVSSLYRIPRSRVEQLLTDGCATLLDLPRDFPASGPALRQLESVRKGAVVVEPGLRDVLARLAPPIAFLDFETINPAIPVWPGCGPYRQVPVQFSCHVGGRDGLEHHAWMADGPDDPREAIARALIAACAGATTVLAYGAPFERRCIAGLAEALPHLEPELASLSDRIQDLLPIIRDHVYHPEFQGSFSLKQVLPALVPELGYEDLNVQNGATASAALEALLFDAEPLSTVDRQALRRDLLQYCERDTLGMVRLFERLHALAEK